MVQQQERQHSEAKAQVAQQKPRDASGRFLSGEELQQYQAVQQQRQFEAERAKIDSILGTRGQPQQQNQMPQQQTQSNFQAILNANKPGARNPQSDQTSESDKWNTMLGKKRNNLRW